MLKIREDILQHIAQTFLNNEHEQGFLLGCKNCLEELEYCYHIPAAQAGMHFFVPDTEKADILIRNWAEQGICFCGFIHSHVVEKMELSQNDIEFAHRLFGAYKLPGLWFGLGVVDGENVKFQFYSVTADKVGVKLTPVFEKIVQNKRLLSERRK